MSVYMLQQHYNTSVDTLQICLQATPSLPLESTDDNGTCLRKHEGVQDLPMQGGREQCIPGVQQRQQRLGFPRLQVRATQLTARQTCRCHSKPWG